MITSLWNKIELHCDEHGDDLPIMDLELKRGQVYYVCTDNMCDKKSGEMSRCTRAIPLKEFEKFMEKITALLDEAELNNEIINLKHHEFHIGKIKYRIFDHNDDKIKVAAKFLNS